MADLHFFATANARDGWGPEYCGRPLTPPILVAMQNDHQIVTVQQHIMEQQQIHSPESDGKLSWVLSGMTLATKMIESRVRRAGLLDILGAAGLTNVQGEQQQKLDVYANQALIHCLGTRHAVAVLVSEENEEPVIFDRDAETGRYIVI